MGREPKPEEWPDLQMDQQAWQKARSEFPNAPVSVVAAQAQEIKEARTDSAESTSDKTELLGNDRAD
jgi:hypothetical protein